MRAAAPAIALPPVPRRWLIQEVWLVFGLSLGASGVNALLHLLADLTNGRRSKPDRCC